jgi:hypothetical protein
LVNAENNFSSETAWPNGAKQSEKRIALGGQAVSEEKIFLAVANQKQELLLAAIFLGQTERNEETL